MLNMEQKMKKLLEERDQEKDHAPRKCYEANDRNNIAYFVSKFGPNFPI